MYALWCVSEIFSSCDGKANFMEMLLSSIVNTHMPTKKMRVRAQDVPYMTKEWKGAIRAKRRAARKYLTEQTSENWEARWITRSEATRLWRKAIRTYWKEQASKLKCNLSEFYKTFMPFLSDKHKGNTNELSLRINGTICRDQYMALKLGATELTNLLTSLFNLCINLGEWPI